MRTIILYASRHHGNTKKLVDAIVEAHPEIDTLDVKSLGKNEYPDLHEYHLIGVATGIYYSEIDKAMARVLTNVLQPQDKVFGLMTYGGKNKWYGKDIDGICRMRQAIFMGVYGCPGFDTWGPFKLTGGVQKGHPTAEEIKGAVDFFDKIEDEYGDIIVEEYAKREKRLAYEKEHPAGGLVAGVKRTAKKIANNTDYFIAEAPLMAVVGKRLGTVLGPRGKMPKPIAPGADPAAMIDGLRKSVTIRTKDRKTFHAPVGSVDMSAEEIAENVDLILKRVELHLEKGKHNIASAYVKTTMGPSERVL